MANGNLFTRSDTMLGICQGLGEDLGFNPNYLRVALGISLVWKPELTIGIYLALGLVVLASRLLFPKRIATPAIDSRAPAAAVPALRDSVNNSQSYAHAA
jgi:phage shock protein C